MCGIHAGAVLFERNAAILAAPCRLEAGVTPEIKTVPLHAVGSGGADAVR
jgi:hypothetical protein